MKNVSSLLILIILTLTACQQNQTAVSAPPNRTPPTAVAYTTLNTLLAAEAPSRDMVDLAQRLQGIDAPRVAQTDPTPYTVGDIETFWYKDLANSSNEQTEATLVYRSDTLNLWLQTDQRVSDNDIKQAAARIEQEILPTNRDLFGTEWQPGIDGDPRLNILHLEDIGGVGAAYFWSGDEYVTAVNPFSNQRELLYISLEATPIGSDQYYSNVAHELQHLIHWHIDANEEAWLNEGLAELAAHLNGFPVERAAAYAEAPDTQLNTLRQEPDVINAHYAAAYLFTRYLHDRYQHVGTNTTIQELVQHPSNGLNSLRELLPQSAGKHTLDEIFADWVADNYLQSRQQENIPYSNELTIPEIDTTIWRRFPVSQTATVNQYAADYISIRSDTPVTFKFTGNRQLNWLPTPPRSGSHYWATIPADESNQHLTHPFDLTNVTQATLTFWTWFDIEEGWDYAYLSVSTDNGRSWTSLNTATTTRDNPQGNNLAAGYTGLSGDNGTWIQETADLTPFTGQPILLRFDYVTDGAVHNHGFLIDDLAIPEIDFFDDMENDSHNWQAAGFSRVGQTLPQQFLIQALFFPQNGSAADTEQLLLDETQQGEWPLPLGSDYDEAIIIISGLTPIARETAVYQYTITQPN